MKVRFAFVAATLGIAALTAAAALGAPAAKSASITIAHAQKGCHVWLSGGKQSPTSKVSIARGGRLVVVNLDTDGHKLVQLAGPAKLKLPAGLKMNGRAAVTFPKPGVYRLGTKVFEYKGMVEAKTVGPDYVLRLTVVVK